MSASLADLIGSIKRDVNNIGRKIAKGVADIAFIDLQEAHAEIMASYYGGYSPVKSYRFWYLKDGFVYQGIAPGYRRTGNLKKSLSPVGVSGGGFTYTAAVNIGSDKMGDYTNSSGRTFPGSAVFDMIWNEGIRGLPPGYRGHVGDVSISAAPVGVAIAGKPGESMEQFVDEWGLIRGPEVADMIAFSV